MKKTESGTPDLPGAPAWSWRNTQMREGESVLRAVADAIVDLAPVTPPVRRGRGQEMPKVSDESPLVLVACSGGADSLALAAATAYVGPRLGIRVGAVIVDHGLQDGSARVARDAASVCRGLKLDPVVVRTVMPGMARAGDQGGEANARRVRYRALADEAAGRAACAVLLGHTLDDQAETVILGLARGAGARSLAGMRQLRGIYRRPLLGVRRSNTEAFCRTVGLEYWDDPTNSPAHPGDQSAPLRSRVRAEIIPALRSVLGSGVDSALARTADHLREDADFLEGLAEQLLDHACVDSEAQDSRDAGGTGAGAGAGAGAAGGYRVETFEKAPAPIRRRALRKMIIAAGSPSGDVSFAHAMAVDGLITDWHGQGPISLPGGVEVVRRCGRLDTSFQQQV